MKQKASLALMEQAIMLLVFALAAALCLRAFFWANTRSLESTNRDRALMELQSAAEVLKLHRGDFSAAAQAHGGSVENGNWILTFDKSWNISGSGNAFTLSASPEQCTTDYLAGAVLTLTGENGNSLAELTVYWQEVAP